MKLLSLAASATGALVWVAAARGQGTRADYAMFDRFPGTVANKVTHDRVEPNWIGTSDRFWFRDDGSEGTRTFYVVDAAADKPTRAPAFDHVKLAAALAGELKVEVSAERLPVDFLTFDAGDANIVRVQLGGASGGKVFRCDTRTYALTPEKELLSTLRQIPPGAAPRASLRTGAATSITFVNTLDFAVDYLWLDPEGRRHPYGTIEAGASADIATYAGHAWVIVRHDDNARAIVAFVAEDRASTAVIAAPAPASRGATPRQGNRRRRPAANPSPYQPFIRDSNLFIKSPDGTETQLTTDGKPDDAYTDRFFFSPDGKKLVAYKTIPEQQHTVYEVESSPADQKQPKLHEAQYLKPGDRVAIERPHLFDLETKKDLPIPSDLFANPFDLSEPRWAPGSKSFTFVFNQRGHQALRVISVDAATGTPRAVVNETSKTFIDYSGKQFLEFIDETNELIWMSERDGWNHLYLYDVATGAVKSQITKGEWVVRGVDRVDHEGRQVYFHASGNVAGQDPYYVHHGRVNFDGTGLTWLTQADGTHKIAWSPDGRFYFDTYSRVDLPPVVELHRATDGAKLLELTRADASAVVRTGWHFPEPFVAKGRDGKTDIYGVIYRPNNFDPSKKYPVIENIYAGPQDSYVPKAFGTMFDALRLAQLGFITVQIDGMGTSNRSKAFHDVCYKNLADGGFPDRILWMKAAAAKYPYMDLTRVGVYGGSAGGQNAASAVMRFGDFYKAAVADCGCHDNAMDKIWWNEQWMGWPVDESYARNSNVTAAKDLKGKLFLMVGELDTNVDPASTMQVVNALIKANKDFDLMVFPGGGHGSGGSPYGVHRRNDFFVRNLLGVEPRS
jgi:dipeptidyl aminopeptidase/acylaminoacyl peptidase